MPYRPVIPPLPVDQPSTLRAVRDIREIVIRLLTGDKSDPSARVVTLGDLVRLGLITQDQADELVKN